MSKETNIRLDRGTQWKRRIIVRTGRAVDAPRLDLTGYTIQAQARTSPQAEEAVDFEIDPIDLDQGEFHLILDDSARAITESVLQWDLLLTAPDGFPVKYLEGAVTLSPTITRPDA